MPCSVARHINTQFDKIAVVTKEDVQRVASKYLKAKNRMLQSRFRSQRCPTAGRAN
jgi:predicted Zn-dependent peptidase